MKILIGLAIVVALYFTFLHGGTFKRGFTFGGDDYSYSRSKGGGDFENYFYTINGEDVIGTRQLVQIVEFPENVLPEQYAHYMQPLFSRYKLKPRGDNALKRVGNFEQAGLKFETFSSPIEIENRTHMVFYLTNIEESRGSNRILRDLSGITFD